jgi:hypothetical protein
MVDYVIESIMEDEVDAVVDDALDNEEIELSSDEEDGIFADTPVGIDYDDEEEEYEDPYIVYDLDEEEPIDNETESEDDEDFFVTEATLLGGYDSFDDAQLIQEAKKYLSKSEIMKDLERADNPTKIDKVIDKFYELITMLVGGAGAGFVGGSILGKAASAIGTSALGTAAGVAGIAGGLTVSMVIGVAVAIIARIIKMPVGSDPDKLRKCQRIEAGIDKGIKDLKAKKNKGKEDSEKIEKVIKELEEGKAKVHAKIEALNNKIDKEE